ncbi:glycosyltransferase family 4 protein [Desulfobulbus alkaliphilus]|uniref:glycosyltransferase family 4 protein n=1 Tax=Desulfobulbus alkaliphilus TaxID=869814 RepID=UPI001964EEF4|nr:glycosyltransferase family 4 protein [Desulfobulbus alkaliphilus]MBM9538344.1 glycosyltransferase family 4 protein [Desulfobulbus alkaliphilus]
MSIRVIHINHSDIIGGAARAAYRIHHCLREAGVDSLMWVNKAIAGDWTVQGPSNKLEMLSVNLRGHVGGQLRRLLKTANPTIHSPSIVPSQWAKRINASDADIVHLHWVAGEMLSIADISRIEKPIVWTLHDMWAFCGAEHYTDDYRWRDGYRRDNRPPHEAGFDLNRWTWQRKRKYWQRPMYIVGDSNWLTQCAAESLLMKDWPTQFIYYPLDLDIWQPVEKKFARALLGLPENKTLLAFGAMGGGRDSRKGFDLLLKGLAALQGLVSNMELVVFGQLAPEHLPSFGFPVRYTGHLHDNLSLRILYSAVDVMVVPSRLEAFGQTASEAHACGTPVVAFDIGGLPDTVDHLKTGYLAKPYDAIDLAHGIQWVIDHKDSDQLGINARKKAENCFAPSLVSSQYLEIYERILIG